ncbi:hypothetical protein LAZ67_11000188 [Cordylochernes scorpioides]|uniref:Endonuclease/exonuclease/phosphatase domain-containing protein n=1 Tax=Cordylochernes scorpioides TaxID=51811 RepID=A0ABY6KXN6_9ARAC|nr:hypothetical protein LAZ67_11000188 [Cordylochernes scorpioides]
MDQSDLLHGQDTTTSVGRNCDQGAWTNLICSMDKTPPPQLAGTPPSQLWIPTSLPSPQHPAIVLGDFNSHHTLWGYSSTDNEGESLNDWMEINDMQFLYADDIALLHQEQSFSTLEQILNEDLKKLESAPVWERSSHTDSIDAQLNQTMRLITGNMRPTPIDWLPYLSNIAPPDLRRKKSTSNLLSKIKANTKLPINTVLEIPPPTRLISRNPAWVADENVDLKEEWRNRWSNLAIANKDLVEDPNTKPPGYNLPRRTWSTLNRIRTSTGRCNYLLNKWNMSPDQNCDCGQIQTMHHILRDCPRRFFQGTLGDIHRCTEEALEWIRHLDIPL